MRHTEESRMMPRFLTWVNESTIVMLIELELQERKLFGGGDSELICRYDEFAISLRKLLAASNSKTKEKPIPTIIY